MRRLLLAFVVFGLLGVTSCSARLSERSARRSIQQFAGSSLVPKAISIQRIAAQSDTEAIAETTVSLAFQFKKETRSGEWRISQVRLGDRRWVSVDVIIAAVDAQMTEQTRSALDQLAEAAARCVASGQTLPLSGGIRSLSDLLFPSFLQTLVREDAWGRPLEFESQDGRSFRLLSFGRDGQKGTSDDLVVQKAPSLP